MYKHVYIDIYILYIDNKLALPHHFFFNPLMRRLRNKTHCHDQFFFIGLLNVNSHLLGKVTCWSVQSQSHTISIIFLINWTERSLKEWNKCSLGLNIFHLLAWKPNLEKKILFFHNFHLSESNFTCLGLRASGLAWRRWESEWLLFNTKWAIFQLCQNKLHSIKWWCLLYFRPTLCFTGIKINGHQGRVRAVELPCLTRTKYI